MSDSVGTDVGTRIGPFLLYPDDRADEVGETLDSILIQFTADGDGTWLVLPQFEIEVPVQNADTGSELVEIVHRLAVFYAGLKELPPEFVNEVEKLQLQLLETHFLPWLAGVLGKAPEGYWTVPFEAAFEGAGRLDLAGA